MNTAVRENVDGQKETLESLLHRVLKFNKEPTIQWHTFLGYFTKRGRLRESEKIKLELNKKPKNSSSPFGSGDEKEEGDDLDESFETK